MSGEASNTPLTTTISIPNTHFPPQVPKFIILIYGCCFYGMENTPRVVWEDSHQPEGSLLKRTWHCRRRSMSFCMLCALFTNTACRSCCCRSRFASTRDCKVGWLLQGWGIAAARRLELEGHTMNCITPIPGSCVGSSSSPSSCWSASHLSLCDWNIFPKEKLRMESTPFSTTTLSPCNFMQDSLWVGSKLCVA